MASFRNFTIIEQPPRRRKPVGLFQSLPPRTMASNQEKDGARWLSDSCDGVDAVQREACPPGTAEALRDGSGPYSSNGTGLRITLAAAVECETVGSQAHESLQTSALMRVAEDKLRYGASIALGRAMSTGFAWRRELNPGTNEPTGDIEQHYRLVDDEGNDLLPFDLDAAVANVDATVLPARTFVSTMDDLAKDAVTQPVVYLPVSAMAFLVDEGPVFRIGRTRFESASGMEYVFGHGFQGSHPTSIVDDAPVAPPSGGVWGVMRGAAEIFRSGNWDETEGDEVSGIKRDVNTRHVWVTEEFTVGYDPCVQVGRVLKVTES